MEHILLNEELSQAMVHWPYTSYIPYYETPRFNNQANYTHPSKPLSHVQWLHQYLGLISYHFDVNLAPN